ncbi:hypothetical protein ABEB36_003772 [Hypothenemus hampei]|uniref:Gamma-interferon-inducible lysosomal thiol reductase n=1 Tax=Hypothenemus hampei TaxID=57062 RepID=A0ABD1F180_HYPHA
MYIKVTLYVLAIWLTANINAISVTVYYEALCFDSVNFITRQLYPNYPLFKDHVTIDFVPYGKAIHNFNTTTGKYTFKCQHGKEECMGNKFQACGLAQIDKKDVQMEFVTCVMSTSNPSNVYFIEQCANKYKMDFKKIVTCASSKEGDELLASNGEKTWNLEPNLSYVPTIVYNNSTEINSIETRNSLVDFKNVVCGKLATRKPVLCDKTSFFEKIKQFFT